MSDSKEREDERSQVKLWVTLSVAVFIASAAIQITFVLQAASFLSLLFASQAAKIVSIAAWSVLLFVFTWCGGGTRTKDGKVVKKGTSAKFAHKRASRYRAIGFFMIVASINQFGNPLLTLWYLGDQRGNSFLNENKTHSSGDLRTFMTMDMLFKVVGAINSYALGFGTALFLFGLTKKVKSCGANPS